MKKPCSRWVRSFQRLDEIWTIQTFGGWDRQIRYYLVGGYGPLMAKENELRAIDRKPKFQLEQNVQWKGKVWWIRAIGGRDGKFKYSLWRRHHGPVGAEEELQLVEEQ